MAKKEKEALLLYYSYKEQFEMLNNKQLRQLIYAMIDFDKDNIEPKLDKITTMAFVPIKKNLEKAKQNYQNKCEINRENGRRGGRPKNQKKPNGFEEKRNEPKKADNEYDSEYDSEYECEKEENKKEETEGNFVAYSPTLSEIVLYASELEIEDKVYCEKFYNHYESIGWVNGSGREIKNWKLVFHNWAKEDGKLKQKSAEKKTYMGMDEEGNLVEVEVDAENL